MLTVSIVTSSQTEDFEFQNDFRPEYDKSISIDQLAKLQASGEVLLLDVRLSDDFEDDPIVIPGAEYKNPESIPNWIGQIDTSKDVVVYCVAGKWVSHKVAHILNQAGISVQTLEGGIEGWKGQRDQ
jgi:Fe-Mn family superoxide dismutase